MEQETDKNEAIIAAIHELMDSADSHVDFIYDTPPPEIEEKYRVGNGEFHRQCIKKYLKTVLKLL